MALSFGFDLGTTKSVVATNAQVIPFVEPGRLSDLVSSAVAYLPEGGTLVGNGALLRGSLDPKNTVRAAKRLMGESYDSEAVQRFRQQYPHDLASGEDGGVQFVTRAGSVGPAGVATLIASHVCTRAALCTEQAKTVVTVPSAFNQTARQVTVRSIEQAGVAHVRLLEEPVATAVAYLQRASLRFAAVYDLGGGTFDFAVLDCSRFPFRVMAHGGDRHLGGDDVSSALAASVAERVLERTGWDLRSDALTYARLTLACDEAKCTLGDVDEAVLTLRDVDPSAPPEVDRFVMDRGFLEATAVPLIRRTFAICADVLSSAGLNARDMEAVFMAGGSTRLFMMDRMVTQYFGRRLRRDLSPERVVAVGASIVAARAALWPLLIPL
jgi:molecular chaperone DnaK (HSP70)